MRVKNHFDSKAENYDIERSSGLLGRVVERERNAVLELLGINPGEEVLDAGCGSGYFSAAIKALGGNPFGVDISDEMIKVLNQRGIRGVVGDLGSLNLKKKFDKIVCCGALEFVDDPVKAVGNLAMHIKQKGIIVMLYPRKSFGGLMYFFYHLMLHRIKIALFSEKQITGILENNGFRVIGFRKPDCITMAVKAKCL